jgi:hypothetical protein
MSTLSLDLLRAFEHALLGYRDFAGQLPEGSDPDQGGRREELLAAIRAARQPALQAGVLLAGERREEMGQLLMDCLTACIRHGGRVREVGTRQAHIRLCANLSTRVPDLRDIIKLAATRRGAELVAGFPTPQQEKTGDQQEKQHADGLVGGRWLWWKNVRYTVPKGTVYRLLAYMWGREFASYDALEKDEVLESSVLPRTICSYANKANNALPSGVPWRLSADGINRQLTKKTRRQESLENP